MLAGLWSQIVDLIVNNQLAVFVALTSALTSAAMWFAARNIPNFAGLGDKVKTAITALAAILVTMVVQLLGGTPDGGLNLATIVFGSTLGFGAATALFRLAKTQPSTTAQAEYLREVGAMPPRVGE